MSQEVQIASLGKMDVIPLHFDVLENYLPLDEFVDTARATKQIIDSLNQNFFDGGLKYEFIVLPPEPGSFKSRFAIVVKTAKVAGVAVGIVWAAAESDIGQRYIKGLTGHEPGYWAEQLGEDHKKSLTKESFGPHREISPEVAALILSESTKGFLTKEYNQLRKVGFTKEKFRSAYQAKNNFYETCYRQPLIRGVGFSDSEEFPIKRNEFPNFIIEVPAEGKDDEENDWIVEILYIKVTSPNWDRTDEQRTWRGKYRLNNHDKFAVFSVEDNLFWGFVEKKRIVSKGIDTLKVQWAFVEEGGRRKYTRVLKVLEYNSKKVSRPYSDEELAEILRGFSKTLDQQQELF